MRGPVSVACVASHTGQLSLAILLWLVTSNHHHEERWYWLLVKVDAEKNWYHIE